MRTFYAALLALALFTSTASADPFRPTNQSQSTEPVSIVIVQSPDGWMCYEILERTSIRFCHDDPTNGTDPMGALVTINGKHYAQAILKSKSSQEIKIGQLY